MRELKLLIQKQAEMIDTFQRTIGKLESRIDDQTRRIGQLTDALSQANRDNSELRGELLGMLREKDKDRNVVESLRKMVSDLETQLEDAKSCDTFPDCHMQEGESLSEALLPEILSGNHTWEYRLAQTAADDHRHTS